MSIDFEDEIKSDFQGSLTWTRIVVIMYGILCCISAYVSFADPAPGLSPDFKKYMVGIGVFLIVMGLILPKSPAVIGSILVGLAAAFQGYLFVESGKVSVFLCIVVVIGIWDIYSYISFNKFAKTHLSKSQE